MKTITYGNEKKKAAHIIMWKEDIEMMKEDIESGKQEIKIEREQLKVLNQCHQLMKKSKLFNDNGIEQNTWDDILTCKNNIALAKRHIEDDKIDLKIAKENLKAVKSARIKGQK